MKNKWFVITSISFLITAFIYQSPEMAYAKSKVHTQKKIGSTFWATEQVPLQKMLHKAQQEHKMILAVFSAAWCVPCQIVKKQVFSDQKFDAVTSEVLLWYIEQTTKKGQKLNKRFNIKHFPTFKLLAADGTVLDTGEPERTVEGFKKWIKDVKLGNSVYMLRKKLKDDPENRQLKVALAEKLPVEQSDERMRLLRQVMDSSSNDDEISQKACEAYTDMAIEQLMNSADKTKQSEKINRSKKYIERTFSKWTTSDFKFALAKSHGWLRRIQWTSLQQGEKEVRRIFTTYLRSAHPFFENAELFSFMIPYAIEQGKDDEARAMLLSMKHYLTLDPAIIRNEQDFVYFLTQSCLTLAKHYKKVGDEAQMQDALTLLEETGNQVFESYNPDAPLYRYVRSAYLSNALREGWFIDASLKLIAQEKNSLSGLLLVNSVCTQAKLFARKGNETEAKKVLFDMANQLPQGPKPQRSSMLNALAWTFVELDAVDQKVLQLAKKSVELDKNVNNLDTLASCYAALGNYKKAMKIEKRALKMKMPPSQRKEYLKKISRWAESISKEHN